MSSREIDAEDVMATPDGLERHGDEFHDPDNWTDCRRCGATQPDEGESCFNCGASLNPDVVVTPP